MEAPRERVPPPAPPGARMVRAFGPLFHLSGLAWLFRRLRLAGNSAETIRRAAARGPLVYVLRTRSVVDLLALNDVLRRRRLPLADRVIGASIAPFVSPGSLLARLARRHRAPDDPLATLADAIRSGENTAIFLKPPPDWRDIFRPPDWPDSVGAVLRAQEGLARPIQLLPVVVVWRRAPERARRGVLRALLGAQDEPGVLRKLLGVAMGHRRAVVQVGAPVDVRAWRERFPDEPARRLRILLLRYCYREAQLIRGPSLKSHRWMRRLVLRSARIRRLVAEEARTTGRPPEAVQYRLVRMYDRMAARLNPAILEFTAALCRWAWRNIYQGIDVGEEDLEAVRRAQREGVAVLVPCHRSHMDYLLLSSLLFDHDIMVPHIVAGDNLAFFPLGAYLRRCGALFIKRSFRGDRVFPVLLQAYLDQLFREGYTVEFFIEGGRSRTGKLLPPRLGVLGATVEAGFATRPGRTLHEVSWLPVAIGYEQIPEEAPYARELAGEPKQRENLGQLVRARRVLRQRFGRVFVRIGEPVRLSDVAAMLPAPWKELDRAHRREVLRAIGERILHRIDRKVVVLPTPLLALAIFAQAHGPPDEGRLLARARAFHDLFTEQGVEASPALDAFERTTQEALARLVRRGLVRLDAELRYHVPPERRIVLEFYKNNLLHLLVPAAMAALALLLEEPGPDEQAVAAPDLAPEVLYLVFLLRYEFIHDPDRDREELVREGLAALDRLGFTCRLADGRHAVLDRAGLQDVAELLACFLESYYLVLRAVQRLRDEDLSREEMPSRIQRVGRELLQAGDLRRPESLSLANLRNAVKAYAEEGLLRERGGGGWEVDEALLLDYLDRLRRLRATVDRG